MCEGECDCGSIVYLWEVLCSFLRAVEFLVDGGVDVFREFLY